MWVIIPFINNWNQTQEACMDVLVQEGLETKILLINNNASLKDRDSARAFEFDNAKRVYLWNHYPPLPSLAATWNAALDFVFSQKEENTVAVLNNDIRLKKGTLKSLQAQVETQDELFVSAVGVTEEDFKRSEELMLQGKGGPDFSCFVGSREWHNKYRFDENIEPLYTEDLDMHRRIMLAGEGHRIYSINIPYLHYASGSLKAMSPEHRAKVEAAINNGARVYYAKKWGGGVNEERFLEPFGQVPQGIDFCTQTDAMFKHGCRGKH